MASDDVVYETKRLIVHIKDNRDKYISGELSLRPALDKTDKLYERSNEGELAVSKAFQDSDLLKIQTDITKERARKYQIDNLVFDASVFCQKLRSKLCPNEDPNESSNDEPSTSRTSIGSNVTTKVWKELGKKSQITMNTVPFFSFIYGTFDADPVQPVKKVRKQAMKDKLGDLTRPLPVTPGTALNEQDVMLRDADRVYTIFNELVKKSQKQAICFYEFVTDPGSFTRTVENIFLVSLLVKDGYVNIFPDEQGLPCLKKVTKSTKGNWDRDLPTQSVLTISLEDWKDIVKTFKFKKAVIPQRTTDINESMEM
ncbi:hypothetical protein JTE90_012280 [Oedothorax gibbosus]|uniref:Non-structural maintenance of chromosomes element 4 n=1 Tax=Oedothorax gibbosus TaxID=931172 RepID=A0AAV6VKP1_9ARAC|nr:hypothetical protein JTE90_012280 [Oedothorax gibbosus]